MRTNVIGDLIQLLEVSKKERMIRCLLCLTPVPSSPPFISSASCSGLLYLECWDEEVDEICSQQAVLDIKRTAGHQGQFSCSFPPSEFLLSLWKGKGSGGSCNSFPGRADAHLGLLGGGSARWQVPGATLPLQRSMKM